MSAKTAALLVVLFALLSTDSWSVWNEQQARHAERDREYMGHAARHSPSTEDQYERQL